MRRPDTPVRATHMTRTELEERRRDGRMRFLEDGREDAHGYKHFHFFRPVTLAMYRRYRERVFHYARRDLPAVDFCNLEGVP